MNEYITSKKPFPVTYLTLVHPSKMKHVYGETLYYTVVHLPYILCAYIGGNAKAIFYTGVRLPL